MERFGSAVKKQFLLSEKFTFLNHGSYGAVAKRVHEAKLRKQMLLESAPDEWFRRAYQKEYVSNVEKTARFLGAKPENVVLVPNATAGANAVLRSMKFTDKDAILVSSWTYLSVWNSVQWVSQQTGAAVLSVEIKVPIKDKREVIEKYRQIIKEHSNIKLAIIDVIVSVPPVYMPFLELCTLLHDNNIMVLLDGAHSPGQIPVELEQWAPDFYVGNLHKWVYCSRGCAALYVRPDHHCYIDPPVISVCRDTGDFRKRFFYQGTDDNTAFCVASDAIQFYKDLGGLEEISSYSSHLVSEAAAMLARRWKTDVLDIPRDMEAPCMRMIRLPVLKQFDVVKEKDGDRSTMYGDLTNITYTLMDRFNIVGLCLYLQSKPYVRISANVYNSIADYEKLADAVLQLKTEGNAME